MRRKGTWMLGVCTCAGAMNLRTRRFCLRFVSPLPFQDTRFHSLVFDVIVLFPLDQMEREKNGGGKKRKKKIEKFILRFYHSCEPSHKSAFIALVPREHGTTRRSRLKRSISKATFHRYLSLTQPPTFRVRGYTMLAKHGDWDRMRNGKHKATYFNPFPFFSSFLFFYPSLFFDFIS